MLRIMKKSNLNKFLLITSVLSVTCAADAALPASGAKVSVGAEAGYYHYREPNVMKLRGWMGGINSAFTYIFSNQLFSTLEGRLTWGSAKYSSNGTGRMKESTPQFLFETRGLLGYNFSVSSNSYLSPFTGFGYRFKSDHSDNQVTTTGHHGYHRYSQYFYMPFGLRSTHTLTPDWSLVLQGEYDLFLRGRQDSKILGGLTHRQKKGYGLKANMEIIRHLGNKRAISFGPYFHYWNIKDSNVKYVQRGAVRIGTLEPSNRTYETGLAIKFHF